MLGGYLYVPRLLTCGVQHPGYRAARERDDAALGAYVHFLVEAVDKEHSLHCRVLRWERLRQACPLVVRYLSASGPAPAAPQGARS